MDQKEYDIFISYRRKDDNGVERGTLIGRIIQLALHNKGYSERVFFDYDTIGSEDFEEKILGAIKKAKIFVFVLTKDSLLRCADESDWVRREICQAVESGLFFIFINPNEEFDNDYPKNFPEELDVVRKINHISIHMGSSFNQDMDYLVEACINPNIDENNIPSKKATVRIETDLDCRILHFGKKIGLAKRGKTSEITLPRGKHKLQFVGLESEADIFECMCVVEDLEYEDCIQVELLDKYNARIARWKSYLFSLSDDKFERFLDNGKWGFKLKTSEDVAIHCKYDDVASFSEGLARVKLDRKWGCIDKKGQEVIPLKYDSVNQFSEGMARVKLEEKYGFVDATGEECVPLKYDYSESFSEGLACVVLNNKYGYVNSKGEEVLPLMYDCAYSFSEGLAGVKLNEKCGFVDKTGKEVVSFKYDFAYQFKEGLGKIRFNGRFGFVDRIGKEVIPPQYDWVHSFYNGRSKVILNGEQFYIDKNGNRIEE